MKITEEQLKDILAVYENLDFACTNAIRAGCLDQEGPLYDRMWCGFETLLSIIDPHGWVSWYIHDNEMGAKGCDAEAGSKMIKVTNLKQLLSLINYEY